MEDFIDIYIMQHSKSVLVILKLILGYYVCIYRYIDILEQYGFCFLFETIVHGTKKAYIYIYIY
jgi:hypothetical protein